MAKAAVQHACTECGHTSGRWFGKCPGCGAFGTLVEEAPPARNGAQAKPLLRLVDVEVEEAKRMSTGVPELDRVLGGGLVPASLVLVGGEPGVGKSTLLLTALQLMSKDRRTLLITGEESVAQVKLRAERLGGAEHLVDCVLQFEGDRYRAHRVLRAVKNRFGSTNEIGVFEMTGVGLVGVPDPSEVFGRTVDGEPGAAVACALEGTRPILLEVQALVARSDLAMPRRVATGVDPKRLAMIVAVLARHAGIGLGQADVFVNVAGGVRIDEPGADLAVALAIASAAKRTPVRAATATFGEIGLTGRLRPATQAERRLDECAKLGLRLVVGPAGTPAHGKLQVTQAETLREAIRAGLDDHRADEGDERA